MNALTEERILQISNNVSEEFADHGQTDFATKAELCQVIQWWANRSDENWQRYNKLRTEIYIHVIEEMLKDRPQATKVT